jgi:hypothetical protein
MTYPSISSRLMRYYLVNLTPEGSTYSGKMLNQSFYYKNKIDVDKTYQIISHLRNIDCLMAHTACLVCFISTVNSHSKKRKKRSLLQAALVGGT